MKLIHFILRYWRRPRMGMKEAGLNVAVWIIAIGWRFHSDPSSEIGLRDEIRWAIEGIGERLFSVCFPGSDSEMVQLVDGCVPWEHLDARQRAIALDLGWTEEDLK
jgi:hypothetical protein